MASSPVILQTEVHCLGCARKIRRAVKHLHGVEGVAGHGAGGGLRLGAQVADRVQDLEAGHRRVRRRGPGTVP
jgi:hypothetical protein